MCWLVTERGLESRSTFRSSVTWLSLRWEGHFPNRQHPCFPALLLEVAFLLAVQQRALSLAGSEAEGGSALEVCCGNGCVEVLHSSCHENFPELNHVTATGDGGCEQQLFLLTVPLAVPLTVTITGASNTNSGPMLGDTAPRQGFQAVSRSGGLAHLSWGLVFRGNEHFTQWLE